MCRHVSNRSHADVDSVTREMASRARIVQCNNVHMPALPAPHAVPVRTAIARSTRAAHSTCRLGVPPSRPPRRTPEAPPFSERR